MGLCNGTRLVVRDVRDHVLYCDALTGKSMGKPVCVPKLALEPSDIDLHFRMRRYQFPVMLSYSMTIHKSQGQSFDRVGVYLNSDVFTHGQLYTALSRVRNGENLKIDTCNRHSSNDDGTVNIKNVVWKELLN